MEEDDLIRIDIPERVLEIIGVKGEELPKEEVERILQSAEKPGNQGKPSIKRAYLKFIPNMPYHP